MAPQRWGTGFARSQQQNVDRLFETAAWDISDVTRPDVPDARLQEHISSAIPLVLQQEGVSLRGLRLLVQQRLSADLSARKANIRWLAEKAVDAWSEGYYLPKLSASTLADLRSSVARIWEPLPRFVDRGRSLFMSLSDVPEGLPAGMLRRSLADKPMVGDCQLQDEIRWSTEAAVQDEGGVVVEDVSAFLVQIDICPLFIVALGEAHAKAKMVEHGTLDNDRFGFACFDPGGYTQVGSGAETISAMVALDAFDPTKAKQPRDVRTSRNHT